MKLPFGKYKGRGIDVLKDDMGYAQWLLQQEWFSQKHPDLYDAIVRLHEKEGLQQAKEALGAEKNILISFDLKHEKVDSFEKYPFSLPVVKHLERTVLDPHVTYIVGENGSGKSTLLEALAITQGFNPEGGTTNFHFTTRPSHSVLHEYLRVVKTGKRAQTGFFLRAESFFNVATEIEALGVGDAYGGTPLHELSHGEGFLALMRHRFGANGLYILDEPEAALSPARQMSILTLIHELVKQGSQFIISTHSPILLAYPHSTIYEISQSGLKKMSYDETQTVQISRQFLDERDKMVDILLS